MKRSQIKTIYKSETFPTTGYGYVHNMKPSLAEKVLDEFARREAEAAPDAEDPPVLTSRQRDVLELVAQGLTNKEIAKALYVTERTIKYHVSQILERLHMRSRHELARYGHQEGMPPPPIDEESPP